MLIPFNRGQRKPRRSVLMAAELLSLILTVLEKAKFQLRRKCWRKGDALARFNERMAFVLESEITTTTGSRKG